MIFVFKFIKKITNKTKQETNTKVGYIIFFIGETQFLKQKKMELEGSKKSYYHYMVSMGLRKAAIAIVCIVWAVFGAISYTYLLSYQTDVPPLNYGMSFVIILGFFMLFLWIQGIVIKWKAKEKSDLEPTLQKNEDDYGRFMMVAAFLYLILMIWYIVFWVKHEVYVDHPNKKPATTDGDFTIYQSLNIFILLTAVAVTLVGIWYFLYNDGDWPVAQLNPSEQPTFMTKVSRNIAQNSVKWTTRMTWCLLVAFFLLLVQHVILVFAGYGLESIPLFGYFIFFAVGFVFALAGIVMYGLVEYSHNETGGEMIVGETENSLYYKKHWSAVGVIIYIISVVIVIDWIFYIVVFTLPDSSPWQFGDVVKFQSGLPVQHKFYFTYNAFADLNGGLSALFFYCWVTLICVNPLLSKKFEVRIGDVKSTQKYSKWVSWLANWSYYLYCAWVLIFRLFLLAELMQAKFINHHYEPFWIAYSVIEGSFLLFHWMLRFWDKDYIEGYGMSLDSCKVKRTLWTRTLMFALTITGAWVLYNNHKRDFDNASLNDPTKQVRTIYYNFILIVFMYVIADLFIISDYLESSPLIAYAKRMTKNVTSGDITKITPESTMNLNPSTTQSRFENNNNNNNMQNTNTRLRDEYDSGDEDEYEDIVKHKSTYKMTEYDSD